MSTLYPTSIDVFNNPTEASNLNSPGVEHNLQQSDANDAIKAIEAKLGVTDSSDVNSVDYKLTQLQPKILFTGAPVDPTDPGVPGTVIVSGGFLYVCIDTNLWLRSLCETWSNY